MIRLGTRGSALALAQARWVASRLGDDAELVEVSSAGPEGDKSRWVSGLERALLADEIDVAVHSAKDVPAELAAGLELIAVPEREDPRDAVCGAASLAELPEGARVGTSSLRRAAQLRALRPDLEVVDIRGNVDTRLRKLEAGECDALVLALAGLRRLGIRADGALDELVPAAGQGALALEARPGAVPEEAVAALRDAEATACVRAERALVHALGASCNTPVGALARRLSDGRLELRGWVGRPEGWEWIADTVVGDAGEVGAQAAQRLTAAGAAELLRDLR